MKKLSSCAIILTFFTSCSNDIDTNVIDSPQTVSVALSDSTATAHRVAAEMPANSENPYDSAGKVYDELLTAYYNTASLPVGVPAVCNRVTLLATGNGSFSELKGPTYRELQQSQVNNVLMHPATCLDQVLTGSSLSAPGRLTLSSYASQMVALANKEYEAQPIYDYSCEFESTVMANATLTTKDKRVILVVASITRHSMCRAKKRPKKNTDPDWTIFIGNITGGTYGGDNDTAEAITTALACGAAQN